MTSKTVRERFFEKVDKSGECWEWTAYKGKSGYGAFWLNNTDKRAHRVSWVLHKGVIPKGQLVLHKCDNPGCVNPDHLFLGTTQDNINDKVAKGRQYQPRGSEVANCRLTEQEVREVRDLKGWITNRKIAGLYGIDNSHVGKIQKRKVWSWLD